MDWKTVTILTGLGTLYGLAQYFLTNQFQDDLRLFFSSKNDSAVDSVSDNQCPSSSSTRDVIDYVCCCNVTCGSSGAPSDSSSAISLVRSPPCHHHQHHHRISSSSSKKPKKYGLDLPATYYAAEDIVDDELICPPLSPSAECRINDIVSKDSSSLPSVENHTKCPSLSPSVECCINPTADVVDGEDIVRMICEQGKNYCEDRRRGIRRVSKVSFDPRLCCPSSRSSTLDSGNSDFRVDLCPLPAVYRLQSPSRRSLNEPEIKLGRHDDVSGDVTCLSRQLNDLDPLPSIDISMDSGRLDTDRRSRRVTCDALRHESRSGSRDSVRDTSETSRIRPSHWQRNSPNSKSRDRLLDRSRDDPRDQSRDHPHDRSRDHPRDRSRDHPRDPSRDTTCDRSRIPVLDASRDCSRDWSLDPLFDYRRERPRDRPRDISPKRHLSDLNEEEEVLPVTRPHVNSVLRPIRSRDSDYEAHRLGDHEGTQSFRPRRKTYKEPRLSRRISDDVNEHLNLSQQPQTSDQLYDDQSQTQSNEQRTSNRGSGHQSNENEQAKQPEPERSNDTNETPANAPLRGPVLTVDRQFERVTNRVSTVLIFAHHVETGIIILLLLCILLVYLTEQLYLYGWGAKDDNLDPA